MTEPWKDPALPLGRRCLLLAEAERAAGVRANPYGQPNTGPRVREYLAGCLRDFPDGSRRNLGLTIGNWCAAFQSWLLEQCLLPGEEAPHLYRAAVVEMELDAKQRGVWHDVAEFHRGDWSPNRGDLVIWDRSDPKDPSTAWMRHTNRFLWWTDTEWTHLRTIGGNEQRTIMTQQYLGGSIVHPKLIGFISYFQPPCPTKVDSRDQDRLLALVAAAIEEIRKGAN